jgi:recombination protein RecA
LLWVRCQNIDQALRSMDLLIQAGGFGMVAVDLSEVPAKTVRQVPLNAWFRFRRAVEDTPTILLLLEQEPHAKTCASLVVRLAAEKARWTGAAVRYPFAKLLRGFAVHGDVVRSRVHMPEQRVVNIREATPPKMAVPRGVFEAETIWRSR